MTSACWVFSTIFLPRHHHHPGLGAADLWSTVVDEPALLLFRGFFPLPLRSIVRGHAPLRAWVVILWPRPRSAVLFCRPCRVTLSQPMEIYVDDETKLTLHGLQQFYIKLAETEKNRKLNDLLDALEFNQVVIFTSKVDRATELDRLLNLCNFPSICIHSRLKQEERTARYKSFKDFQKRILVATDLFGRGIDIERVNIVINYDFPDGADGSDQYLHRVGRAGRWVTWLFF
ncbi:unnamed protein product [Discosporangium mesarthrocarpum]